ncbi:hypothetical protein BOTNAR_0527g00010 [Botryotinia narcissicola]|uniref:Uncharacterized protein n=1 Tax=Botryotinia narcissicola TaxID=278944 RepID=A0A4Z1HE74_9HELO|nr:hypothetical protein BOTNAR_0527g00010 [Botryotinia narcissicola]
MTRIVELGTGVQTLKLIDNANDDTLLHAFTEEDFRKALCPHLKVLILGPTDYGSSFEPYDSHGNLRRDSKCILEYLCDYYHTICAAKPLQLRRLVLPAELIPGKPASEKIDNYLEQLTNTSFITDLGFFNGLVAEDSSNSTAQFCDIDYTLLENVSSLRSLKITRIDSALRAWMDDEARNFADLLKLTVTQLYSMYDSLLLPGHGRSLTKLGLYLDFATQWVGVAAVPTAFRVLIQTLSYHPMTHCAT